MAARRRSRLWNDRRVTIDFPDSPGPTLGVEWEFALVDKCSHDHVNAASELFKLLGQRHGSGTAAAQRAAPQHRRAGHRDPRDRRRGHDGPDEMIAKARPLANELGIDLYSAGTHKFAVWSHQPLNEGHRCEGELMPAPSGVAAKTSASPRAWPAAAPAWPR